MQGTCMGWSRDFSIMSGAPMSRAMRASTWHGSFSSRSKASPSGHFCVRLSHSRRICAGAHDAHARQQLPVL